MRNRSFRLTLAGALLATSAAAPLAAAQIYRTQDADGNPVFTDQPPGPGQAAEAVELDEGNSFEAPPPSEEPATISLEEWRAGETASDTFPGYRTLRVLAPAYDEAIRDNAGNVTVAVGLEPALRPGHVLQLYLDGQLRETGRTTRFELSNVDRGTHQLTLEVVDGGGTVVSSSEPSVFHLQRYSRLLAPNRSNAP